MAQQLTIAADSADQSETAYLSSPAAVDFRPPTLREARRASPSRGRHGTRHRHHFLEPTYQPSQRCSATMRAGHGECAAAAPNTAGGERPERLRVHPDPHPRLAHALETGSRLAAMVLHCCTLIAHTAQRTPQLLAVLSSPRATSMIRFACGRRSRRPQNGERRGHLLLPVVRQGAKRRVRRHSSDLSRPRMSVVAAVGRTSDLPLRDGTGSRPHPTGRTEQSATAGGAGTIAGVVHGTRVKPCSLTYPITAPRAPQPSRRGNEGYHRPAPFGNARWTRKLPPCRRLGR